MSHQTLEAMVQTIYNLNWKGRPKGDQVDWVKHESAEGAITVFPTAIDYTISGKVHQIKWEINNNRVINLGIAHTSHSPVVESILKDYLGYK